MLMTIVFAQIIIEFLAICMLHWHKLGYNIRIALLECIIVILESPIKSDKFGV